MVKVVINACFGGFGLSPAATRRLAELQGRECYFFKPDGLSTYEPVREPSRRDLFWDAFSVPDPTDVLAWSRPWHEMTDAEKQAHNDAYRAIHLDDFSRDRANPLLVRVVEEMGSEAASGACAELKIVEVPDGVAWEISEYDGNETIHEQHRTWG